MCATYKLETIHEAELGLSNSRINERANALRN